MLVLRILSSRKASRTSVDTNPTADLGSDERQKDVGAESRDDLVILKLEQSLMSGRNEGAIVQTVCKMLQLGIRS